MTEQEAKTKTLLVMQEIGRLQDVTSLHVAAASAVGAVGAQVFVMTGGDLYDTDYSAFVNQTADLEAQARARADRFEVVFTPAGWVRSVELWRYSDAKDGSDWSIIPYQGELKDGAAN